MKHALRLSTVAAVCGLLSPIAASAAGLTVTQQGIVSSSVPKGAQRAVFIEASLHAACDADVLVRSFSVKHRGLGEASDLVRVYATEGDVRLSRTRSLDSSDRAALLAFVSPLKIKACGTARVQVRGDFSPDAQVAGEHGLLIEAVDADAPVTLASATSSPRLTARPSTTGTVSVTFLPLTKALQFGKGRTVARLRLEADNGANQRVSSVVLTNDGKAVDGDLANIRLEDRKGNALTNVAATLDGDKVRLTFEPALRIDRNDQVLLELKADIVASNKRTLRFVLEEPSDLEAAPRTR
jgi:hypothetical protein